MNLFDLSQASADVRAASPAQVQLDEQGRLRHFLDIEGLPRSVLT